MTWPQQRQAAQRGGGDGIRPADPHETSTPEDLIGKLLEAADPLEDDHEALPQQATAYFATASGLREAARALSLVLNKPCEPPVPEPTGSAQRASTH